MTKTCDNCGKPLGPRRKRFCRNKCKDQYHNRTDPRKQAYGTYLNRRRSGMDSEEILAGWKDDILSGDPARLDSATYDMEMHPHDPEALGQE